MLKAPRVLQDPRERRVLKASRVLQDQRDRQVLKDRKGRLARRAPRDRRDRLYVPLPSALSTVLLVADRGSSRALYPRVQSIQITEFVKRAGAGVVVAFASPDLTLGP